MFRMLSGNSIHTETHFPTLISTFEYYPTWTQMLHFFLLFSSFFYPPSMFPYKIIKPNWMPKNTCWLLGKGGLPHTGLTMERHTIAVWEQFSTSSAAKYITERGRKYCFTPSQPWWFYQDKREGGGWEKIKEENYTSGFCMNVYKQTVWLQ